MSHGDAQLALPGLVAEEAAEWVWEGTGEEADGPDFVHATVVKGGVAGDLPPPRGLPSRRGWGPPSASVGWTRRTCRRRSRR